MVVVTRCRCEAGGPRPQNQESPNCLKFQLDLLGHQFVAADRIPSGALERLNNKHVLRCCCESLENESR